MKKEIADNWIKALRSGEYTQGYYALKSYDGFCCLGVLCDLHSKVTDNQFDGSEYLGSVLGLSLPVMKWAGMQSYQDDNYSEGSFPYVSVNWGDKPVIEPSMPDQKYLSLSVLNDSKGYKFEDIANFIEMNWEIL